jgi:hypothetical protein
MDIYIVSDYVVMFPSVKASPPSPSQCHTTTVLSLTAKICCPILINRKPAVNANGLLVTWRAFGGQKGTVKVEHRQINPLNAELNPICHLLSLLEAHHILHVSRIKVNRARCFVKLYS